MKIIVDMKLSPLWVDYLLGHGMEAQQLVEIIAVLKGKATNEMTTD